MKNLKVYMVLIGISLLVGCAGFNKPDEYHSAQASDKAIAIPSDINNGVIDNYYPIPKAKAEADHSSSVLPPESI